MFLYFPYDLTLFFLYYVFTSLSHTHFYSNASRFWLSYDFSFCFWRENKDQQEPLPPLSSPFKM